jgi:hypothetical protein
MPSDYVLKAECFLDHQSDGDGPPANPDQMITKMPLDQLGKIFDEELARSASRSSPSAAPDQT